MFPRAENAFFKAIFGFAEEDYISTQEKLLCNSTYTVHEGNKEECIFTNPDNGLVISAGRFYTPSARELRAEVARSIELFESSRPGYLQKLRSVVQSVYRPPSVDSAVAERILALTHVTGESRQMHSLFPGALFQAASQFNLLEFIDPIVVPEMGISSYVYDATQGPACALACFAGTAYRNYLIHPDYISKGVLDAPPGFSTKEILLRGQQAHRQLNLLDDMCRYMFSARQGTKENPTWLPECKNDFFQIQNGYFSVTTGQLQYLKERWDSIASHLFFFFFFFFE